MKVDFQLFILNRNDNIVAVLDQDDLLEAYHEEEVNGDNSFTFSLPAAHEDAGHVSKGNQISFLDDNGNYQLFEIDDIEDEQGDEVVKRAVCPHGAFEIADDPLVEDLRPSQQLATVPLSVILSNSRWKMGEVGDLGNRTTNFYRESPLKSLEKLLDIWQGEVQFRIEFEGNTIKGRYIDVLSRRGGNNGARLTYEENLMNVTRTVAIQDVKTALYGFGRGEETVDEETGEETGGFGRRISFADVEWRESEGDPVDKPAGQDWIGDEEALQSWGRINDDGTIRHRYGYFEDSDEEDPERLLQTTWDNLQQQKNAIYQYDANIIDLYRLLGEEHYKMDLGDTVAVINDDFSPILEVSARMIRVQRNKLDPSQDDCILGSFLPLYTNPDKDLETIKAKVKNNSGRWDNPVVTDARHPDRTPPTPNDIQAEGAFRTVLVNWEFNNASYIAAYELYASEVRETVTNPENLIYRGKSSAFSFQGDTNQTYYFAVRSVNYHERFSGFSDVAEASTARIVTDDILFGSVIAEHLQEGLITADKLADEAVEFVEQKAREYTDEEVSKRADEVRSDLYDSIEGVSADIDDVDSSLSQRIADRAQEIRDELEETRSDLTDDLTGRAEEIRGELSTQKTDLQEEISDARDDLSADLSSLNSDLSEEISRKIEAGDVDEAITGLVRTVDYEEDQQGQINRFESNETKIEQTEEEISQQAQRIEQNENDLSEARTSINQNADAIELKAEESHVNALEGTLEENTAEIKAVSDAVEIRVTEDRLQESIDDIEVGARNLLKNGAFLQGDDDWTSLPAIREEDGIYFVRQNYGWGTRQANIPVTPGKTYNFGALARNRESDPDARLRFSVRAWEQNTNWSHSVYCDIASDGWERVSGNLEIPDDVNMIQVYILNNHSDNVGSAYLDIAEVTIFQGTKDLGWIPAPEDTTRQFERVESSIETEAGRIELESQRISDLGDDLSDTNARITVLDDEIELRAEKTTVDNIENEVSSINTSLSLQADEIAAKASQSEVDDLSGTVSDAQTELSLQADEIAAKASQSEVNDLSGTVSDAQTELSLQADEIAAKASQSEVDDLSGTVSDAQTELSLQADEIAAKASQSEVNDLTGEVSDTRSELRLLSDEVDIRVTEDRLQESIDDIEVGGRNLLKSTQNPTTSEFYRSSHITFIADGDITHVVSGGSSADYELIALEPGKTYAISSEIRNFTSGNGAILIQWFDSLTGNRQTYEWAEIESAEITGEWKRFYATFTVPTNGNHFFSLGFRAAEFKLFKLERGNKATDWTPAPEDTEEKLERNETSINAVSDEVSIQARRITETGDDLSDARTEINALADEVEIKASQTEVNDIEGRLSDAESSLRVLPDEIDAKVDANGIVSSLNLSSEGVRIAGDLIRLTGQSEIDDAVIGNAAIANGVISRAKLRDAIIGRAQIENAAIDNAKIASVNADKVNVGTLNGHTLTGGYIRGTDIEAGSRFYSRNSNDSTIRTDIRDAELVSQGYFTKGSITSLARVAIRQGHITVDRLDDSASSTYGMSYEPDSIRFGTSSRGQGAINFGTDNSISMEMSDLYLRGSVNVSGTLRGNNANFDNVVEARVFRTRYLLTSDDIQIGPNSTDQHFRFYAPNNSQMDLIHGDSRIKYMRSPTRIGFLSRYNTNGITVEAGDFNNTSTQARKTDIERYSNDGALDIVKQTDVYSFNTIDETNGIMDKEGNPIASRLDKRANGRKIGLLYEEAPIDIIGDETVNLYAMTSFLWKAVQQLSDKVEALENAS